MSKSEDTAVDFDVESNAYVGKFSEDTLASAAVVDVLASIRECDTLDVGPLAYSVDTDALNRLVTSSETERLEVSFDVDEFTVRVNSNSTIVVTPR